MPAFALAGLLLVPRHPALADPVCLTVTVAVETTQPRVVGPVCAGEYGGSVVCATYVVHGEPAVVVTVELCAPAARTRRYPQWTTPLPHTGP